MMGRPIKSRIVRKDPDTKQFSPRGHRGRPGYNELKMEEVEAIRLIDHMGLKQAQAAGSMGVSQQTFSRVLRKARKALAEALVLGHIIKVQGGVFKIEK
jgi:Predicted DNA-binding proteins